MVYKVTARLKEASAQEFQQKLLDGTIASQKPDGQEIVDSMNRAVVTGTGEILWSETCYCSTPLAHERETVLDHHFEEISTEAIDSYEDYQGRPFMEYLAELADSQSEKGS